MRLDGGCPELVALYIVVLLQVSQTQAGRYSGLSFVISIRNRGVQVMVPSHLFVFVHDLEGDMSSRSGCGSLGGNSRRPPVPRCCNSFTTASTLRFLQSKHCSTCAYSSAVVGLPSTIKQQDGQYRYVLRVNRTVSFDRGYIARIKDS
jgi:hypothetical protein